MCYKNDFLVTRPHPSFFGLQAHDLHSVPARVNQSGGPNDRANGWDAALREAAEFERRMLQARESDDPLEEEYFRLEAKGRLQEAHDDMFAYAVNDAMNMAMGMADPLGLWDHYQNLTMAEDALSCMAAGGDGACFVAGTLVKTADGYVPLEKLQVGDRVWTALAGETQKSETAVDPATWKKIELLMTRPEGGTGPVRVTTLVSPAEIARQGMREAGGCGCSWKRWA
jgi:hypothetical protein